ncbi:MAG: NAD(P)-dependent oxidoreductase, partial [Candidatus Micrarchaeota archaeon]|nr:NAD(P)-dependent oxidoreductase [Candidatus Micrarchaeota archaeon]
LQAAGHQAHALVRADSESYRLRKAAFVGMPADRIHEVGLEDAAALGALLRQLQPDVVMHLAMYGGNPGQTDAARTREVNVEGTRRLLEAMGEAPGAMLIHTGSSSEYGNSPQPMREEQECRPSSEYGKTKLEAAQMVQKWAREKKRRAGILRLFSPYGPYDHGFRLIPSVILACARQEDLALSSPAPMRDFVYVKDVVGAYEALMGRLEDSAFPSGEIFNVGSGEQHSVRETAETIARIGGSKIRITYGQESARGAESAVWRADLTKSQKMLGWKPEFSFEDGLGETYQWYRQNLALYPKKE